MRRILTPIFLFTLLFPSFAYGDGLICKMTGWNCAEVVDYVDLVEREGLYYRKFTEVPFRGKTTCKEQWSFYNGKRHGPSVSYHKNGQKNEKRTCKHGNLVGATSY